MADVLRFWLRRGVDGFRIGAAAALAEDARLRDDPPNPDADERAPPWSRAALDAHRWWGGGAEPPGSARKP